MKDRNRPAYWQLDLFVALMIGLMLAIMAAQLAPDWTTAAEIGWCALTIAGMGLWVRGNRAALLREDYQRRSPGRAPQAAPAERTIPMTPVQDRFLAALESGERQRTPR